MRDAVSGRLDRSRPFDALRKLGRERITSLPAAIERQRGYWFQAVTRKQIQKYGIVAMLLVAIGGMTVAVSYSVTLYRLFCSVTGAGGTTQRVASASNTISDKVVTV